MNSMTGKVVLVIAAHPDDPEFGCGATVAKYVSGGAKAYYVICTNGQRGSRHHDIDGKKLTEARHKEQKKAADIIGVTETIFLDHEDGALQADMNLKEELVKIIRKLKPDIIFTHDPSFYYFVREDFSMVNHNDHRETGIATLDAVYPLARDLASFPDHKKLGLTPHNVPMVLLFNFDKPNYLEDVTDTFETKYKAILEHESQVDDAKLTRMWLEKRLSSLGKEISAKYAEGFTKLVLR
ncbi:MAG: PIG-L deacetylase family protein [Candidatus Daviesbacteria bacterium]|nr:PIG-L deacetylase family protein [Candidatus Daviesbacteria bacterium]